MQDRDGDLQILSVRANVLHELGCEERAGKAQRAGIGQHAHQVKPQLQLHSTASVGLSAAERTEATPGMR